VLSLGRNPNCLYRSRPCSFTFLTTLLSRVFSKSLPKC
jgi:hypothetical protein